MPLPRILTLVALIWCMIAYVTTVGTGVPIQPTTLSYTPGVRALVVVLAFGAFAIYPLGRISTARGSWPPARVALDAITMSVLFTVLFWPVQLVTYWPRATGVAVWVLVLGWTWAGAGAVAAALTLRNGWARAACALICPALLGAGALLDALGVARPLPALLGPAVAVLDVAPRASWAPTRDALAIAAVPWAIALVVWALASHRAARAFAPAGLGR